MLKGADCAGGLVLVFWFVGGMGMGRLGRTFCADGGDFGVKVVGVHFLGIGDYVVWMVEGLVVDGARAEIDTTYYYVWWWY